MNELPGGTAAGARPAGSGSAAAGPDPTGQNEFLRDRILCTSGSKCSRGALV